MVPDHAPAARPTVSLRVHSVAARRGASWVQQAFALLGRHFVGFAVLLLTALVPTLLLTAVPLIGPLLAFAMGQPITFGFAVAARAAQAGEPVRAAHMLQPLLPGADPARRSGLLRLCMLYTGAVAAVMVGVTLLGGEALQDLATATQGTQGDFVTRAGAVFDEHPGLRLLLLASSGLFVLLSVLFWHAPMLVWWHGQGVAQSLFSSALAIWRNKGAYSVYSLAWIGVMMLLLAVTGVLQPLFGSPEVAALALQPVTLIMMAAFYISAYFSYVDCLGTRDESSG
jgi:hypothetical protein